MTRISSSTLALLASTCLAASLASTLYVSPASAGVFGLKVPPCMNADAIKQIEELKMMKQHEERMLKGAQQSLAEDTQALADADSAIRRDVGLLKQGAANWPAGFNPGDDIGKQQVRIPLLVRAIGVDEMKLQNAQAELVSIEAWLRADYLLPPCETVSQTIDPGTEDVPTTDILMGPPVEPPVLGYPRLDTPTEKPSGPADGFWVPPPKPTSGFPPKADPEPEKPSLWERFKRGCRDFFECQTDEDLKKAHHEAVRKAMEERRAQSQTGQIRANHDATGTRTVNERPARTATVEDRNVKRAATARSETTKVSNGSRNAAVHMPNASRGVTFAGAGATRMSGMQTSGVGALHTTSLGATHMGGMGGMHMGGMARR
jgi:hypothetical protein